MRRGNDHGSIDFAYQLDTERGFEPWTTFKERRVSSILDKILIKVPRMARHVGDPDLIGTQKSASVR
jgi:hypothetical protein